MSFCLLLVSFEDGWIRLADPSNKGDCAFDDLELRLRSSRDEDDDGKLMVYRGGAITRPHNKNMNK